MMLTQHDTVIRVSMTGSSNGSSRSILQEYIQRRFGMNHHRGHGFCYLESKKKGAGYWLPKEIKKV
jgi:hypothetical protein